MRFGSAHLRLAPAVLPRTTFCYPDSSTDPVDVGTAAHMPLVAVAVADERAGRFDVLDAWVVGEAVRAGSWDPQELKRFWHCVARSGRPAA